MRLGTLAVARGQLTGRIEGGAPFQKGARPAAVPSRRQTGLGQSANEGGMKPSGVLQNTAECCRRRHAW